MQTIAFGMDKQWDPGNYSTGNYILSHMIMGEKRMYTCMCDWVTLLYNIKLTEHCKSAIMEKIKIIVKKRKNKYI